MTILALRGRGEDERDRDRDGLRVCERRRYDGERRGDRESEPFRRSPRDERERAGDFDRERDRAIGECGVLDRVGVRPRDCDRAYDGERPDMIGVSPVEG